ncbi:hypothetical protein K438DRAFT_1753773 [Mycena galopus ATCC 62051]|nr:hypothetical protein K438DRAFT_1753773 [Mycena galopus ATCC 62051]
MHISQPMPHHKQTVQYNATAEVKLARARCEPTAGVEMEGAWWDPTAKVETERAQCDPSANVKRERAWFDLTTDFKREEAQWDPIARVEKEKLWCSPPANIEKKKPRWDATAKAETRSVICPPTSKRNKHVFRQAIKGVRVVVFAVGADTWHFGITLWPSNALVPFLGHFSSFSAYLNFDGNL